MMTKSGFCAGEMLVTREPVTWTTIIVNWNTTRPHSVSLNWSWCGLRIVMWGLFPWLDISLRTRHEMYKINEKETIKIKSKPGKIRGKMARNRVEHCKWISQISRQDVASTPHDENLSRREVRSGDGGVMTGVDTALPEVSRGCHYNYDTTYLRHCIKRV